ncbi:MAG: tRNA (adenosine(37)-N6)-threonylcarbamoyltransferase complex ATPase subunit type 1 TsaE [Clostridia bacterium]|nr:tRNA (adenosine(37)-N6)-threonylcarbamoyltransferase complex ATPase subunit type 1 TsaE [Clostridia bacterium]
MKKIYKTTSPEETENIAREFANGLDKNTPQFIAMYGDLGVGKTAFVRGIASKLAPEARVKSPTYTVVNEYRGTNLPLYHFDVYRIEGEDDLYSIGFYEYLQKGICVTEWSENIEDAIPKNAHRVTIERGENPENERIITIEEYKG